MAVSKLGGGDLAGSGTFCWTDVTPDGFFASALLRSMVRFMFAALTLFAALLSATGGGGFP